MKRLLLIALFLTTVHAEQNTTASILTLPELSTVTLDGPLRVVATTSIIGDVVTQVGGDAVQLTTLIEAGQDPHGFEPAARDLATASEAHVVFVNGWGLEETLLDTLEAVAKGVPFVPVSAEIAPLGFGANEEHEAHSETQGDAATDPEAESEDGEEHDHGATDPHTWLSVPNVMQWVGNVQATLSTLDPDNAATYTANAKTYLAALEDLEAYAQSTLGAIPEGQRKLVTNHDAFGYFAAAYDFEVVGTVIPSSSTLAEPSASTLAELIREMGREGICTLFTETTGNRLAETVAAELNGCDTVQVLSLYTGALGSTESGADSYLKMMRTNIDTIARGLVE